MKDTQARLEEHEQNKVYMDKILAFIKEREPVLLQTITSSLASRLVFTIGILGLYGLGKNGKLWTLEIYFPNLDQ